MSVKEAEALLHLVDGYVEERASCIWQCVAHGLSFRRGTRPRQSLDHRHLAHSTFDKMKAVVAHDDKRKKLAM